MRDPSQRSAGITNHDVLNVLRKTYPVKNGMRLRTNGEPSKRNAKAATLWTYIQSRGEYEIHETVLVSKETRSSVAWSQFFAKKVFKGTGHKNKGSPAQRMGILEGAILPGVNMKTRPRVFELRAVIGYALHDNPRAIYTALHQGRHKA